MKAEAEQVTSRTTLRLRPIALALLAVALYGLLWPAVTGDMNNFLIPWLDTILDRGPIGAFAEPFSNYTPPYLYLLALMSPLASVIGKVGLIKALSVAGTVGLMLATSHLLKVAGRDRRTEAVLWLALLPSVAINAAGFGQCDAIWSAACVLAVASAIERRPIAMLVWFGVGIAFKAQAIFLAPFVAQQLLLHRSPARFWTIPAAVYGVAILPAALTGWPVEHLLTIYLRQAEWNPDFISNASNPWSLVQMTAPTLGPSHLWIGYVATAAATVAYIAAFRRAETSAVALLALALLSALFVPYLLPKMHERFFFLADVLALMLAFIAPGPRTMLILLLVAGASTLSLSGLLLAIPEAPVAGAFMNLAAMALLVAQLRGEGRSAPSARPPAGVTALAETSN